MTLALIQAEEKYRALMRTTMTALALSGANAFSVQNGVGEPKSIYPPALYATKAAISPSIGSVSTLAAAFAPSMKTNVQTGSLARILEAAEQASVVAKFAAKMAIQAGVGREERKLCVVIMIASSAIECAKIGKAIVGLVREKKKMDGKELLSRLLLALLEKKVPALKAAIADTCGPCWHEVVKKWGEGRGMEMQVMNGARGGTGPDNALLCMEDLLGGKGGEKIDLFILEFAINAGDCKGGSKKGGAGYTIEALFKRVRRFAPSALMLLLNTFSLHHYLDAAPCMGEVAKFHSVPVLSWKDAIHPLIADGRVRKEEVMEPPLWHHPNVRGHEQLGGIVTHYLSRAAALTKKGERGWEWKRIEKTLFEENGRERGKPFCRMFDRMKPHGTEGWSKNERKGWYETNEEGATFATKFECEEDGCGLLVGVTKSYQPLGMINVTVDGIRVMAGVSEASAEWRKDKKMWTVNSFLKVVKPRSEGGEGMEKGGHVLEVVSLGRTTKEAEKWETNYKKNEVHVRGIVVVY